MYSAWHDQVPQYDHDNSNTNSLVMMCVTANLEKYVCIFDELQVSPSSCVVIIFYKYLAVGAYLLLFLCVKNGFVIAEASPGVPFRISPRGRDLPGIAQQSPQQLVWQLAAEQGTWHNARHGAWHHGMAHAITSTCHAYGTCHPCGTCHGTWRVPVLGGVRRHVPCVEGIVHVLQRLLHVAIASGGGASSPHGKCHT
jgi:hypothetical protein